jgi:hypothetical protein
MLDVLGRPVDETTRENARNRVSALCRRFPLYSQSAGET